MDLTREVKKKREFRGLPDSLVERVLKEIDGGEGKDDKSKVKEVRVILRKYFGVFLTNKVIKPKDMSDFDFILKSHKSSMKRNYNELYSRLRKGLGEGVLASIIDLGCGLNGFSYSYLCEVFGDVNYIGVEAASQVVDNTNSYFNLSGTCEKCMCIWGDLFDISFVLSVLRKEKKPRLVLLFQVIDALENLEENYSKEFLKQVGQNCEYMVISLPTESLSGKKRFEVKRKWILDFLNENFEVLDDYELHGERFICLRI